MNIFKCPQIVITERKRPCHLGTYNFCNLSGGHFPVRTNSVKFENVRAKYVTGRRSDTSLRVRAKKLLSEKKIDSISTFFPFRLWKSFTDQSESLLALQGATYQREWCKQKQWNGLKINGKTRSFIHWNGKCNYNNSKRFSPFYA